MEQIFLFGDPWLIIVSDEGMRGTGLTEQGSMEEQAGLSTPRIRAGKASSFLTSENAHQSSDIFRNLLGQEWTSSEGLTKGNQLFNISSEMILKY